MEQMVNHSTGWVRMEYLVPARGLIGFRTEFLTETRGTGILHHVFDRWEPWAGELRTRPTGALVADRRGKTASFALFSLQERGTLFIGPGEEVYEGMIVGENARSRGPRRQRDQGKAPDQRPRRQRRRAGPPRPPPTRLSLEAALEFLRDDECVEVTPESVRLRKVVLDKTSPPEGGAPALPSRRRQQKGYGSSPASIPSSSRSRPRSKRPASKKTSATRSSPRRRRRRAAP